MQTQLSPRFGALLPIKTALKQSADGTVKENREYGKISIGNAIERMLINKQPGSADLIQQVQALDPTFQTEAPILMLTDYREPDKPDVYFVTGKKDVETARATYYEALKNELAEYNEKVIATHPLPFFKNSQVGLSSDEAQSKTVDTLKKSLTVTEPIAVVEEFTAVPGQFHHNKTLRIKPYQA